MTKKILVMGLPGSGKTTFSQELVKKLMITHSVKWFNADTIRTAHNDWDFSPEGRQRQVDRMRLLAESSQSDYVICDFVCPTEELRNTFNADIVIWMDTITAGRFEDTNKVFTPPTKFNYRITDWEDVWVNAVAADLAKPKSETMWRSFAKAYSYRVCGTLTTITLSYIFTGQLILSLGIGATEMVIKPFIYWLHERVWNKVKWGKQ